MSSGVGARCTVTWERGVQLRGSEVSSYVGARCPVTWERGVQLRGSEVSSYVGARCQVTCKWRPLSNYLFSLATVK